ncbi:uncharacterized protein LOC143241619 [Tachypleus tridentatus]|uniref:uncharacterized protein LOC143241619 n=1 Tax=Tachypleus tridentatus TaxID=6853 RepID=UPI003FD5C230
MSSMVQKTIEHLNIQLGSSQEEAVQEALEVVNKEHHRELQCYQQLLDVEIHKLEDAHQEIEVYQQQLLAQNDVIDNLKQEFEAGIRKIQSECERERKELEQKLILEQELELESVRMELKRVQSEEILELTQALNKKDAQIEVLYEEKQSLEEVLTERFQHDRTTLVQELEKEYQDREKKSVEWALQEAHKNHQEQLERVQREREQHMEMFQEEITKTVEEKWKNKLVQLREEMDSECKRELEDKHILWEKQKEEEIKALQGWLDQVHKSELESLRSRFRLAMSTTTMERSPSDSSLEKSHVQKDETELNTCEGILTNLQHQVEIDKEQLIAEARETEKQIWETKLQSTVEELADKYENQMAELAARLSREHKDHCEGLKARIHAEKQVTFNQAVEQVSREKDYIVESLQKEKAELVMQLRQEKERLESIVQERLDVTSGEGQLLEKENREEKMKFQNELLETRTRFSESRHVQQWDVVAGASSTLEAVLEETASENQAWTGTKSLHEQMKPAESQALGHLDKVSVLTCNIGDIILLRYDDRYENYLAFYLGPVLHFLNTDCMEALGLKSVTPDSRKLYALAEVTHKEYCQAKKAENRYKLPVGSRFYRIKAKPWFKDAQSRKERQTKGGSSSGKYLGSGTLSASTI